MITFSELNRIHIELSSACNAACPVCPRNFRGGYTLPDLKISTMSLEKFKKIITPEVCQQINQVVMCGVYGDPIYCKDLPSILQYLHEQDPGIVITLNTNGGMRSTDWWSKLATANPNLLINFSIDGLEDTNHIYRRNVKWKKLIENVTAYLENGGKAWWEFLIFKHNQHQVDSARELAKSMGFESFTVKHPFGFEQVNGTLPRMEVLNTAGDFDYYIYPADKENRNEMFDDTELSDVELTHFSPIDYKLHVDNFLKSKSEILQNSLTDYKTLDNSEIDCMTKRVKEIYIDSNGIVYPCCFFGPASDSNSTDIQMQQYLEWRNSVITIDKIDASERPLKEILDESGFLDSLEENWKKTHACGKLMTCTSICIKNYGVNSLYVNKETL